MPIPVFGKPDTFLAGSGTDSYSPSGVIHVNTTAVGTDADTAEKDLMTYSLPANSLSANGKGVRITVWGTVAANANGKTVRLYFGSTVIDLATLGNNAPWDINSIVIRTGTATQDSTARRESSASAPDIEFQNPTEDETGAIVIKITGQNGTASANDIVAEGMIVEFLD